MKVIIKKKGLYAERWSTRSRRYIQQKIDNPLRFLRWETTVESGVTLQDIFDIVEGSPVLLEFLRAYSQNPWMSEFHNEAKCGPKKEITGHLRIYRSLHVNDLSPKVGEIPELEFSAELDHIEEKTGEPFSISFLPMNEIAHLPVVLQQSADVIAFGRDDTKKLCGPVRLTYSLLDVMDAIYWEIGWYGSPLDRDKTRDEVERRVDAVKTGGK